MVDNTKHDPHWRHDKGIIAKINKLAIQKHVKDPAELVDALLLKQIVIELSDLTTYEQTYLEKMGVFFDVQAIANATGVTLKGSLRSICCSAVYVSDHFLNGKNGKAAEKSYLKSLYYKFNQLKLVDPDTYDRIVEDMRKNKRKYAIFKEYNK